jgi:hypothetical protein
MLKGLVFLMTMFSAHAMAQTVVLSDNFTFGYGGTTACASITAWNGIPNAYPQDMGGVCLGNSGSPYAPLSASLSAPWQLGFLNNGDLAACAEMTFGPKVFSVGDGTHVGDVYTLVGSTSCPYYTGEYGGASDNLTVGFSVVASYVIGTKCNYYRGRCVPVLISVLEGGTGTVTETQD